MLQNKSCQDLNRQTTPDELQGKANRLVRDMLQYQYEKHRPYCQRGGIGSDAFAEAYGNSDVAYDVIAAAQAAALDELLKPDGSEKTAQEAADRAAFDTLNEARANNLIFIRDGTRSATVVKAYMLSTNLRTCL